MDLARQSNPNFFIVTPAPSRGRKLGKPAKQKIEWGKNIEWGKESGKEQEPLYKTDPFSLRP